MYVNTKHTFVLSLLEASMYYKALSVLAICYMKEAFLCLQQKCNVGGEGQM